MLDVRRLRVLREVAARGTIAAAATALDFTPSAVSQQLAALEREAGVALVDRGPSSVVLTEAGRRLVHHADAVLAQLAVAEAELRAIGGLRSGRLRIGAFATVSDIVGRALHRFRAQHPDVELSVTEREAEESLAELRRGGLDVAVVYSYDYVPLYGGEAVELHDLLRDPVLVALPRTHRLAGRSVVELGELAGERWLTQGQGAICQRMLEGAAHQAGFEPRVELAGSDDYRIVQSLVAAEIGIAFIPRLARRRDDRLAFVAPAAPLGRTIAAACRAGGRRSAAVATMIDILAETAAAA